KGKIERDFEAEALRLRAKRLEIVQRAELGIDGCVPAELGSDRPRAAGVVRARDEGIVAPFSMTSTDWMDRRKVQNVEPEIGESRKSGRRFAKRRTPRRRRPRRPRKHLVPRSEAGALAIDPRTERRRTRRTRAIGVLIHHRKKLFALRDL